VTNPLTLRLTQEHKELIVRLGLKAKEMNSAQRMRLYKKYRRKPGTDALLSLLLPGLGQIVQKRVGIGLAILIFTALLITVWIGILIWIWSIYDAYTYAKEFNDTLYEVIVKSAWQL